MPVPRLLQVIHLGAWGQPELELARANAIHAQVEAVQNDSVLLHRVLSNDARNVRVGQHWSRKLCELRLAFKLIKALVDANIEFGVNVGLLSA